MQHSFYERFFPSAEIKKQFKLALPIYLAQISSMGMVFVDTAMTGQYHASDLAAVALAAAIWSPVILFGVGCLLSLTPLTAQLVGAKKGAETPHLLGQGIVLSCILSVILMTFLYTISFYLEELGLSKELSNISGGYLRMVLFSVPPFLFFINIRSFFEGYALTRPAMVISVAGLLLNIPLNYILIYGKFGLPALGAIGCGVATSIVYLFMFIFIVFYLKRDVFLRKKSNLSLATIWPRDNNSIFDWSCVWRIITIGFPNAVAMFCEVSLFAVTALLLAPLGTIVVAGHQVAMNVSGLLFMAYLALNITATIRIGTCLGAGKINSAHIAAWTAMGIALVCTVLNALIVVIFNIYIPLIYSSNAEVIALSSILLLYAATFQIVDGIQAVGIGVLRGYNDTKVILIVSLICYWCIGLPLGYTLTYTDYLTQDPLGARGFWIAYITALFIASIFFIARIKFLHKLNYTKVKAKIGV